MENCSSATLSSLAQMPILAMTALLMNQISLNFPALYLNSMTTCVDQQIEKASCVASVLMILDLRQLCLKLYAPNIRPYSLDISVRGSVLVVRPSSSTSIDILFCYSYLSNQSNLCTYGEFYFLLPLSFRFP